MSKNQDNEKIKSSTIIINGLFQFFLAGWQARHGSEPVESNEVVREHFQAFLKSQLQESNELGSKKLIKWVDLIPPSPLKPSNS